MDIVLALALTLTTADPALAGAPEAAPSPPPGTVVMQGYRASTTVPPQAQRSRESRRTVSAHPFPPPPMIVQGRAATVSYEVQPEPVTRRTASPARVHPTARGTGRTVTLEPGFFASSLTGGVEAPVSSYRVYGRSVVIIGGPSAPPSAGQAATALGLPRG
jgi:hypothetical protein